MPEASLMKALRAVAAPGGSDIVTSGLVEGLHVKEGVAHLTLRADRAQRSEMERVAEAAAGVLRGQPGIARATVVLTAHRAAAPAAAPQAADKLLPGVRRVIAVASGKGGVGKSTVAVNLAVGLSQLGLRTGLVDADIHGPSLARMLGIDTKPEVVDGLMQPIQAYGLRANSMAFLVPEQQAMIWRGPMVMGALQQLLGQTAWGALDVMVVDLPPGTGDAQLTLSQRVTLAGAVIVSTPQDIALIDARRGIAMFQKLDVPVLGIVENMSFFACPQCGHETPIFGHGGARAEAEKLGVPFLGEVPLLADVRQSGDAGRPILFSAPESPAAIAFRAIAATVWRNVNAE